MSRKSTKKENTPVTTAQKLGSVIKSARDIMRKDKGLSGELDRLPQLTWIMFLKLLDDVEKIREVEAELEGISYHPPIKAPYRWRDWAGNDYFSGDRLLSFINNDKIPLAALPQELAAQVSQSLIDESNCISGLLAYLRSLQSEGKKDRKDVIARVFQDVTNRITSGALLFDVFSKVNEIHFDNSEEVNILSLLYESMVNDFAWKYEFKQEKEKAIASSQVHLHKAQEAGRKVDEYNKQIKELEGKIKSLEVGILDFTPQQEQKKIKASIKEVEKTIQELSKQVEAEKAIAKDEQEKANNILSAIYNLERKNPNSGNDFEHLPPEQLIQDIMEKDAKINLLMGEIQNILNSER